MPACPHHIIHMNSAHLKIFGPQQLHLFPKLSIAGSNHQSGCYTNQYMTMRIIILLCSYPNTEHYTTKIHQPCINSSIPLSLQQQENLLMPALSATP